MIGLLLLLGGAALALSSKPKVTEATWAIVKPANAGGWAEVDTLDFEKLFPANFYAPDDSEARVFVPLRDPTTSGILDVEATIRVKRTGLAPSYPELAAALDDSPVLCKSFRLRRNYARETTGQLVVANDGSGSPLPCSAELIEDPFAWYPALGASPDGKTLGLYLSVPGGPETFTRFRVFGTSVLTER